MNHRLSEVALWPTRKERRRKSILVIHRKNRNTNESSQARQILERDGEGHVMLISALNGE